MAHRVFIAFLFFITIAAVVAVGLRGFGYYFTPVHERPFRSDYEMMKTSGNYSLGLGIIGATMIIVGVSTYSTRKRVRALWDLGKLSRWLEFHIFLCLLGPVLVIFHTTFKAGGVAAITLWTMISVASSGIVGRFLYVQIPRNLQGAELDASQIARELDRLSALLASSPIGALLIKVIDERFASMKRPATFLQAVSGYLHLRTLRREVRATMGLLLAKARVPHREARDLERIASVRASLLQKSIIVGQVGRLFHYWHVIHLPFSIIMFITLAAHVVVSLLMGYTWIF